MAEQITGGNKDPFWREKLHEEGSQGIVPQETVSQETSPVAKGAKDPFWRDKVFEQEEVKKEQERIDSLPDQSIFQDAMDFIESPIDQTGEIIDYGVAGIKSTGNSLVAGAVDWADNQLESEDRSQSRFTLQKAKNSIKARNKAGEGLTGSQKFIGETISELPAMGAAFIPIVGVPLSVAMSAVQSFGSVVEDQISQGKNLDVSRGGEALLGELVGDFISRKMPFLKGNAKDAMFKRLMKEGGQDAVASVGGTAGFIEATDREHTLEEYKEGAIQEVVGGRMIRSTSNTVNSTLDYGKSIADGTAKNPVTAAKDLGLKYTDKAKDAYKKFKGVASEIHGLSDEDSTRLANEHSAYVLNKEAVNNQMAELEAERAERILAGDLNVADIDTKIHQLIEGDVNGDIAFGSPAAVLEFLQEMGPETLTTAAGDMSYRRSDGSIGKVSELVGQTADDVDAGRVTRDGARFFAETDGPDSGFTRAQIGEKVRKSAKKISTKILGTFTNASSDISNKVKELSSDPNISPEHRARDLDNLDIMQTALRNIKSASNTGVMTDEYGNDVLTDNLRRFRKAQSDLGPVGKDLFADGFDLFSSAEKLRLSNEVLSAEDLRSQSDVSGDQEKARANTKGDIKNAAQLMTLAKVPVVGMPTKWAWNKIDDWVVERSPRKSRKDLKENIDAFSQRTNTLSSALEAGNASAARDSSVVALENSGINTGSMSDISDKLSDMTSDGGVSTGDTSPMDADLGNVSFGGDGLNPRTPDNAPGTVVTPEAPTPQEAESAAKIAELTAAVEALQNAQQLPLDVGEQQSLTGEAQAAMSDLAKQQEADAAALADQQAADMAKSAPKQPELDLDTDQIDKEVQDKADAKEAKEAKDKATKEYKAEVAQALAKGKPVPTPPSELSNDEAKGIAKDVIKNTTLPPKTPKKTEKPKDKPKAESKPKDEPKVDKKDGEFAETTEAPKTTVKASFQEPKTMLPTDKVDTSEGPSEASKKPILGTKQPLFVENQNALLSLQQEAPKLANKQAFHNLGLDTPDKIMEVAKELLIKNGKMPTKEDIQRHAKASMEAPKEKVAGSKIAGGKLVSSALSDDAIKVDTLEKQRRKEVAKQALDEKSHEDASSKLGKLKTKYPALDNDSEGPSFIDQAIENLDARSKIDVDNLKAKDIDAIFKESEKLSQADLKAKTAEKKRIYDLGKQEHDAYAEAERIEQGILDDAKAQDKKQAERDKKIQKAESQAYLEDDKRNVANQKEQDRVQKERDEYEIDRQVREWAGTYLPEKFGFVDPHPMAKEVEIAIGKLLRNKGGKFNTSDMGKIESLFIDFETKAKKAEVDAKAEAEQLVVDQANAKTKKDEADKRGSDKAGKLADAQAKLKERANKQDEILKQITVSLESIAAAQKSIDAKTGANAAVQESLAANGDINRANQDLRDLGVQRANLFKQLQGLPTDLDVTSIQNIVSKHFDGRSEPYSKDDLIEMAKSLTSDMQIEKDRQIREYNEDHNIKGSVEKFQDNLSESLLDSNKTSNKKIEELQGAIEKLVGKISDLTDDPGATDHLAGLAKAVSKSAKTAAAEIDDPAARHRVEGLATQAELLSKAVERRAKYPNHPELIISSEDVRNFKDAGTTLGKKADGTTYRDLRSAAYENSGDKTRNWSTLSDAKIAKYSAKVDADPNFVIPESDKIMTGDEHRNKLAKAIVDEMEDRSGKKSDNDVDPDDTPPDGSGSPVKTPTPKVEEASPVVPNKVSEETNSGDTGTPASSFLDKTFSENKSGDIHFDSDQPAMYFEMEENKFKRESLDSLEFFKNKGDAPYDTPGWWLMSGDDASNVFRTKKEAISFIKRHYKDPSDLKEGTILSTDMGKPYGIVLDGELHNMNNDNADPKARKAFEKATGKKESPPKGEEPKSEPKKVSGALDDAKPKNDSHSDEARAKDKANAKKGIPDEGMPEGNAVPVKAYARNDDNTLRVIDKAYNGPVRIDGSERAFIVMDVDGMNIPFYLSSGLGGKLDVPTGKWYPFFGVSDSRWINKTGGSEMANHYDSPRLKAMAEALDAKYGDLRTKSDLPESGATIVDQMNRDFNPANRDDPKGVRASIDKIKKHLGEGKEVGNKDTSPSTAPKKISGALDDAKPKEPTAEDSAAKKAKKEAGEKARKRKIADSMRSDAGNSNGHFRGVLKPAKVTKAYNAAKKKFEESGETSDFPRDFEDAMLKSNQDVFQDNLSWYEDVIFHKNYDKIREKSSDRISDTLLSSLELIREMHGGRAAMSAKYALDNNRPLDFIKAAQAAIYDLDYLPKRPADSLTAPSEKDGTVPRKKVTTEEYDKQMQMVKMADLNKMIDEVRRKGGLEMSRRLEDEKTRHYNDLEGGWSTIDSLYNSLLDEIEKG